MYLSKLEILGFKSFAHKTLLKFDSGMTSIVGPNGCGKTNVVDAIRWALGEQKAGTLRSDTMENVIFNGTKTRKPLGMSEVSLTIENTKGILPTEYSEVTITRRLFRSGESEYLLNKANCRLKDIIELFMDTGMGANAYSVIELKMIETILSDRTEERRKLFEEAAGITKYKVRRKEAMRRLDQVSTDLSRVDDIVKEVRKAVGSLERQAEKAQKHAELSAELRTIDLELLERDYASAWSKIEPLRAQLAESESSKDRITGELEKVESLLDVLEQEEAEIEEQLGATERTLREKSDTMSRTRETIVATEERIRSLRLQKERAATERARLLKEQEDLGERIETLRTNIAAAIESRDALASEKNEKESRRKEAEAVVRARRDELQRARDAAYQILDARNQHSHELERRRAKIDELERRRVRLGEENERFSSKFNELDNEWSAIIAPREAAQETVASAEQAYQKAQDEKDGLKRQLDETQNLSFGLQNEIGKKLSKIEFFTGLVEQGIGAGEGTEFLLSETGWSSVEPVTVADAVITEPKYRPAFESVLGEAAHYLIVPHSSDAFEAIELLKHAQKGKATFVCLDRVPEYQIPHLDLPAGSISAFDVSRYADKYANLFRYLLGGIVITDTVEGAYSVLAQNSAIEKCVTQEGEVVTRSGFLRAGSRKTTEGVLIGKREQINELEDEVTQLKRQLEAYEQEIARISGDFEAINPREFNQAIRSAEEEKRKLDNRFNQLEYERKRLTEQSEGVGRDIDKTSQELEPLRASLEEIDNKLAEADTAHGTAQQTVARLQNTVEEAEKLLTDEAQRSTQVQVKYAGLSAEVTRYESELRQTERSLTNAGESAEERTRESERIAKDLEEFTEKLEEFRVDLTQKEEEIRLITERRDEIAERRKTKQAEAHQYRETLREERVERDKTLNISHELALKIQDLESKLQAHQMRALEEFEITELERKEFDPTLAFSFGDARETVRDLKQRIRNLGAVNLLAYEEYSKEKERLDFLTTQRQDLTDAQKNLVETIGEINETATRQFLETFELIRGHFQNIFGSLFSEGDECDLKLEDDKDPLEAQIEIIAKPRGKRPHSIELLSGGEKTMTAIALLFSIYLVKPSPFCILDEVDAPLDDSNIDRFLSIIRSFAKDTQFIVVTHNKRTMAAADALYGVTQEEDGISKIVSVRLKKETFEPKGDTVAVGGKLPQKAAVGESSTSGELTVAV